MQEERKLHFTFDGNVILAECNITTAMENLNDVNISVGASLLRRKERKPERKDKRNSAIQSDESLKGKEPRSTRAQDTKKPRDGQGRVLKSDIGLTSTALLAGTSARSK